MAAADAEEDDNGDGDGGGDGDGDGDGGENSDVRQGVAATDPTKTQTLRSEFISDFRGRWRTIRGDLRETIQTNDAFQLRPSAAHSFGGTANATATHRPYSFGVTEPARKRAAFREWFEFITRDAVLEPANMTAVLDGHHWTNEYVQRAAARGIIRATVEARKAGYEAPASTDLSVSDLLKRKPYQNILREEREGAYADVQNAVERTRTEVNRTFRDRLGTAPTPQELADELTERVAHSQHGETQTTQIANSVVVRTVNRAALVRYLNLGVETVGARPETVPETSSHALADSDSDADSESRENALEDEGDEALDPYLDPAADGTGDGPSGHRTSTLLGAGGGAGVAALSSGSDSAAEAVEVEWAIVDDRQTCEDCLDLAGRTYPLADLVTGNAPTPPLHPNCRCFILPI